MLICMHPMSLQVVFLYGYSMSTDMSVFQLNDSQWLNDFYALRASWSIKDLLSALICEEIFIKYISCTSKTKKQTTLQKWKLIYTLYIFFFCFKNQTKVDFPFSSECITWKPCFANKDEHYMLLAPFCLCS